jgi:hypothetical protein
MKRILLMSLTLLLGSGNVFAAPPGETAESIAIKQKKAENEYLLKIQGAKTDAEIAAIRNKAIEDGILDQQKIAALFKDTRTIVNVDPMCLERRPEYMRDTALAVDAARGTSVEINCPRKSSNVARTPASSNAVYDAVQIYNLIPINQFSKLGPVNQAIHVPLQIPTEDGQMFGMSLVPTEGTYKGRTIYYLIRCERLNEDILQLKFYVYTKASTPTAKSTWIELGQILITSPEKLTELISLKDELVLLTKEGRIVLNLGNKNLMKLPIDRRDERALKNEIRKS